MSDWYQAVVDLHAEPQETEYLALKLVTTFMTEGLIQPNKPLHDENGFQEDYRAGPNFHNFFKSTDQIGILQTFAKGWHSEYGIIGLESAACSICGTLITSQNVEELIQLKVSFAKVGQKIYNSNEIGSVRCPICSADILAQHWQTIPHLGFSHLAFVFWNWPPFEDCRLDLMEFIDLIIGHKTVLTYGHL